DDLPLGNRIAVANLGIVRERLEIGVRSVGQQGVAGVAVQQQIHSRTGQRLTILEQPQQASARVGRAQQNRSLQLVVPDYQFLVDAGGQVEVTDQRRSILLRRPVHRLLLNVAHRSQVHAHDFQRGR